MDILVYADWKGLEVSAHMGILSVTHTRGHAVFTFSYDTQWVKAGRAQNLDPDLQFYDGPQFLAGGKPNFGLFLDSSPDRWGRVLMDRREAILARKENRKIKPLFEEDYLLGVYDAHRMGAWEMVVNELAEKAGIAIAKGMARIYNSERHTFLSRRFDRTVKGERIHFASAMTLLGQTDGTAGASYLQLAEFILQNSASPNADLEELWRRIIFYIAVKNTDDHLRNHGFLLTPDGWTLSPAYDVNPVYFGTGLTLNISETDNALDWDLARSVAKYFRIKDTQAAEIIAQTRTAVSQWPKIASKYKIKRSEQELMAQAFEHSL